MYSLLLVRVTMVWGWMFVAVRDAVALYAAPRLSRRTLITGVGTGLILAFVYLLQTAGLLFISPMNSGFITRLFVVFAPLADRLFFGARPSRPVLVTVGLSLLGMISASVSKCLFPTPTLQADMPYRVALI